MPNCGSQITLCNLPIRFDTYIGCSHGCKYCFVQKKTSIKTIKKGESPQVLKNFIDGKRTQETNWCDWNIPLHWGGMSDPFQPIEKIHRYSYECLKLFAESQYPFVVSTKGRLVGDDEYADLLAACNAVVQISMVCSKYDKLEPGAPSYEERLRIIEKLNQKKGIKRTIARVQPYMTEVFDDVMENIPRLANAGVYGIVFEGMKFFKKKKGMVQVGGDQVYPMAILKAQFTELKEQCHKYGVKFYAGENRLRAMGDGMCCCGIDGLPGFIPNEYNICMMLNGEKREPTERMKQLGTAHCFKSLAQDVASTPIFSTVSFAGYMQKELKNKPDYYKKIFGLHE